MATSRLAALAALLALTLLPGCIAVTAVRTAGDVVEGTANATVFTAKTAGKVAGAAIPGGGDDEDKEDDE